MAEQGAVLIEYIWHEEMGWHLSHRWLQEALQDMSLPVHLLGITCTDPIYAEWDRLVSRQAAAVSTHRSKPSQPLCRGQLAGRCQPAYLFCLCTASIMLSEDRQYCICMHCHADADPDATP